MPSVKLTSGVCGGADIDKVLFILLIYFIFTLSFSPMGI